MEKKNGCGCGCSRGNLNAGLKKDARKIVREVEGYTAEDHTRKQAEVKAAFAKEMPHATAKTKKKGNC
jgi:hypothetical protein